MEVTVPKSSSQSYLKQSALPQSKVPLWLAMGKNQEWTVSGLLVVFGFNSNFPLLLYTIQDLYLGTLHILSHPMVFLSMFLFHSRSPTG